MKCNEAMSDLSDEAHCERNQPKKTPVTQHKSLEGDLNGCTWVTRQSVSVMKVGVAYTYQGV